MIGSNRKCAGNHPLSAGSPRQGATHRLDRCIIAPLLRKGFPGYPTFHAFRNSFLHTSLGKCLFQNVHHIIVRQHFRPYQKTFQHSPSGAEPVRCALPGASCGKRMIASTLAAASNHHRGRYASPALAAASYPFVDLPPGNTLRCKLFPSSKFYRSQLYFSG